MCLKFWYDNSEGLYLLLNIRHERYLRTLNFLFVPWTFWQNLDIDKLFPELHNKCIIHNEKNNFYKSRYIYFVLLIIFVFIFICIVIFGPYSPTSVSCPLFRKSDANEFKLQNLYLFDKARSTLPSCREYV